MSKSSNHNLKICIIFLKSKNRAIRKKTNSVFKRNRQIAETFCKANTDFDVEILTNQATDKIPEKYQFSSLREAFQNKNVKNFDAALTIYNQFEVSPENILNCLKSFEKNPRSIISLTFKYKRRPIALGRKIRIWWSNTYFRFITGIKITGYRSGLRIYPVKPILSIKILSTKATCETELAARYSWRGGNIIEQKSQNEFLNTTCIS
ncbi:MAG: hypothetical protein U9N85_04170, partial [Bacteroidota bacterium]|nr:hypothetical protein [Bacteroidota bacterium]